MLKANIIEFIEDPLLLNDRSLSLAQKTSLKAIYGLPLTKDELELWREITGRSQYVPGKEETEITFILGRRSGKSDKLASNIALYEACVKEWKVSVGEVPVAMLIASERERQARILYHYIKGKLESSGILSRMIDSFTADEIRLTNGILIGTYPCIAPRVRGRTLIFAGGDEVGHWKSEGISVDSEVLDALRPGLMPGAKLVKISTPGGKLGELWTDHRLHFGVDGAPVLVIEGSTALFNPSYSKLKLWGAEKRGKANFEVEYLAKFRDDLSSMYLGEVIDACVNPDVRERGFFNSHRYQAFVDVSGGKGRDSFSIAIGHEEQGRLVVDVIRSRVPPFNVKDATEEFANLLKTYRIKTVVGDTSAMGWPTSIFAEFGVKYQQAERSKSQLYIEIQGILNSGKADLPDREPMISQFKSLVRKSRSGGRDKVDTPDGRPEDEPNAVAGLLYILDTSPKAKVFFRQYNFSLDPEENPLPNPMAKGFNPYSLSEDEADEVFSRGIKVPGPGRRRDD